MRTCTIIGISDAHDQWFCPEVMEVISSSFVFSGGKRHYGIVEKFLPSGAVWIDITVPLSYVFMKYERFEDVVIFASGDPLFFGFANTVMRKLPDVRIKLYPYFNSLQILAHRMLLPYQDMKVVSLTGRRWLKFDAALIRGEEMIGVLTDKTKTPCEIARRMLEYGYDNYSVTVGECLGNEDFERVRTFAVTELADVGEMVETPNCLILRRTQKRKRRFGIPEDEFDLLDGRRNMITKAPVRLATLTALGLADCRVFWDVGFCTGSVSIEAKTQFPELEVVAFERRESCEEIMRANMRRFGTPGIDVHIGDFMTTDISALPAPDAAFIGGHGGQLVEMVEKLSGVMAKGGRIVLNAVSERSVSLFEQAAEKLSFPITSCMRLAVDEHNPILVMIMEKS